MMSFFNRREYHDLVHEFTQDLKEILLEDLLDYLEPRMGQKSVKDPVSDVVGESPNS